MRRLFVFRPEPAASRTVARAKELGLDAVALPLFKLEPIAWNAPDEQAFDAILLTSANAVAMAGDALQQLRALPVHAVGEATATAAEVAGFGVASRGRGGVEDLLANVPSGTRLLHLCGEDRRPTEKAQQPISFVPVYRAATTDAPDLATLDDGVALVHSPRAGRRLAELVPETRRAGVCLAAISAAAADAAGTGWATVRIASAPTDEALLALAARLCET